MKLSRELRQMVERLGEDLPAQTQQMIDAERKAIGDYASIREAELARDVYEVTGAHARIWYESLLAGHAPDASELEPFAEIGRRRMQQGFHLPSLLHAVRLASIVLWNCLIEATRSNAKVRDELLYHVSPYLLLHFDLISQAITRGYMEAERQRARWHEQLMHELSTLVFARPDDVPVFRELMRALNLDAAAPYAAFAFRLADEESGRDAQPDLDALLQHVAGAFEMEPQSMVRTLRHGQLLLWLPASAGDALYAQEQQVAAKARAMLSHRALRAVGVGLPGIGPAGWRESADQAQQALEIGRSVGSADVVLRYSELALDDAVRTSPGAARYLESLVESLAAEPALLETLDAYFLHRQHRKACAAALGIHINTLAYRLDRIEALLGAQLDTPAWLARLHAALRLRPAQAKRQGPDKRR